MKAVVERHKLKLAVVLDRDGGVAAKYAVTAIPQTVVIDRDGKIARRCGRRQENGGVPAKNA